MGNVEMHDLAPVRNDERKELNLGRKVNYKQYLKHVKGENVEGCLTEVPWGVRDAVSLYERMDISFNSLTELPVELPLRLPHLNYINLSYNHLTALPESFGLLFHLKNVILNNNNLRSLPDSFTHLVKLERLDLSHNCLRELPEDLGTMEALSKINVCHNKLKKLPMSIGTSETITVILAKHNRLETPSQCICDEGSEATLKFLRKSCLNWPVNSPKTKLNIFPRIRGNQLHTAVPNPHSAHAQYIQSQTDTSNTASRIKTPLLPPLGASQLEADTLRDRIIGLLYGAAIGDAIGIATTHMNPDECKFHYDADNLSYRDIIRDDHRVHWKQGDWTSNFDHACLLLESLTSWGGVVDELDFAQRLQSWCQQGLPEITHKDSFIQSETIKRVTRMEGYTKVPHSVSRTMLDAVPKGEEISFADHAASVRSIVLGIPLFHDIKEVIANETRICNATHCDPRCVATAVIIGSIVALLLQGKYDITETTSLDEMIGEAGKHGEEVLQGHVVYCAELQKALATKDFQSVCVHERGREDFCFKALSAGLAALQSQNDYRSAVIELVMQGGESSTNAALAGAFIGCRDGYSHLPTAWVEGLRKKQVDWLNHKINFLLDMMGIP